MRTHDELERLAAAGLPFLSDAEELVGAGERDRILERILATPRPARVRPPRLRTAFVLAGLGLAVAAVAALASGVFPTSRAAAPRTDGGRRHVALSGARIELAGYRFRTPAGFKASPSSCVAASSSSGPTAVVNGFSAAASAEGGCLEAFLMASHSGSPAEHGAEQVAVGSYQGYYVPADASGESTLYVRLPAASAEVSQYLALFAEGLAEQQLIAIAQSGLPRQPIFPSTTTGTERSG